MSAKFTIGQKVKSGKIGIPTIGKISNIIPATLLTSFKGLAKSPFNNHDVYLLLKNKYDKCFPNWLNEPVYEVAFDNLQKSVSTEEAIMCLKIHRITDNKQSFELSDAEVEECDDEQLKQYWSSIPLTSFSCYPEQDLELL